ncbi:MAG: LPS-assembly protein LptD [Deltaproteobacteria bacterium]|nr:LPS-assembly protein LptD [Deltaproteobacteria bacterium]
MKKLSSQLLFASLLLLTLCAASHASETNLIGPGGLNVKADSITYDKKTDTYDATGKVRIDWSGVIMFADEVTLRQSDNLATAEGNVLFRKGEDTLHADRVTLDLETAKGEVSNGRLFVKQGNFRLSGEKMLKTGVDDYHVERGSFTTCDGEVPSWKFSAAELDVTREEYAVGRHAIFYIKDVPVLYFPYIVYPVKEERQSGFLIPRVGISSKKGFYLEVPYYLVVNPSQDATFYLDIQTKRGAGAGAEYRYMLRSGGFGNLNAYLIYDTDEDMLRGNFLIRHQQSFSPTLFFRADIDLTLDRDFYRDYGEVNGEYNRQYLESSAFITKHWERYSLTTELRYVENLYAVNNKATLQKLPNITFTGIKQQLLDTPFYVSFDSTFTNFQRQNGLQGQRLDLHPMLTYYTSPGGILEGAAWVGYRQRLYNTYGGDINTGFSDSGIPDVGASLSSTFSRVYDTAWGNLKKVKHTIIPEVTYSFLPQQDQDDLPFFDYNDRLVSQNMIGYSLTNYLTGKYLSDDTPATYRDLAYLRISQGYEFSGTRRDVLTLVDEQRPFTDIRLEAKLNPTERLSFYLDSRFNPYELHFSTLDVSTDLADSEGNSVGVGYRFSRDEVRYLEGKLNISYVEPFVFHYLTRYSFDTRDFLESYYALEYKQQCWGVTVSYRERPGDRSFVVNFTLSGIGAIGKFKAF